MQRTQGTIRLPKEDDLYARLFQTHQNGKRSELPFLLFPLIELQFSEKDWSRMYDEQHPTKKQLNPESYFEKKDFCSYCKKEYSVIVSFIHNLNFLGGVSISEQYGVELYALSSSINIVNGSLVGLIS